MQHIKKSIGDYIFDIFNYILLTALSVACLYPMLYVIFASLSDPALLAKSGGILLAPKGFQLETYKAVFRNSEILSGYANTIFYVVVGTGINLFLTILGAYVLSRKVFCLKKPFLMMITFTMFINGGLVPNYLLVKDIGLLDSRLSILLPGAISAYNLIMMRTYFNTIPEALSESAKIDGAGHWRIMLTIILPLSAPIIAVITLYYSVAHWNSWFNAMIYLSDREKWPLQLFLREILILNDSGQMLESTSIDKLPIAENLKYATIVVATVPILCVYPMVQKYFMKGVMIGAVKE